MTPAQIEASARELCKLRGKDPDALDEIGYRFTLRPWSMAAAPMSNWRAMAHEVERFAQIGEAIIAAQQTRAPRKRKEKQA